MKKVIIIMLFLHVLCVINLSAQLRSFDEIFSSISTNIRNQIFSGSGYLRTIEKSDGSNFNVSSPAIGSGISPVIINDVIGKNPPYIAESILVIPAVSGSLTLLNVYNALGNIRGLRGRLYFSATRNREVPLFEDATRIRSERQTTAIADPAPSGSLPQSETVFIRLRDDNFGNTYYRGQMSLIQNGLCYSLTNFRNMNFILIPVIREGNFTAQLYFEPIREGVLIYSLAGADVSDFVASQVHISSAIAKRLEVIVAWAAEGILQRK